MRLLRALTLATIILGVFVLVTTYGHRFAPKLLAPVAQTGRAWSDPLPARSAGFNVDEQNNIDIYRYAREATVNITSTVYRRSWFEIYPAREMGSGFIISSDGRIITNAHVLQGQGKIEVTLHNHDRYTAQALAVDRRNDLAIIQITPKRKLAVLRLGDSDNLQVGQKVLAIGNPFGLEGTLTVGIISSMGRDIQDERSQKLEGMIQTDAAINPGNSGGPLLDSSGNVIGINTAILGSGGNIGIGFALPITRVKTMLTDFQAGRRFGRPWLGVSAVYVVGDLAEALDLPSQGGLLIQDVPQGSPAASVLRGPRQVVVVGNTEVGIGGDLIMAIDGSPVDRADALSRSLNRKRPGDPVTLTIYRAKRKLDVKFQLGEYPEE